MTNQAAEPPYQGENITPAVNKRIVKQFSRTSLVLAIIVAGSAGFLLGTRSDILLAMVSGVPVSTDTIDLSSVQNTYRILKANYDGDLDTNKLIDGASRGLTAAVGDRHTVFMDKEETKAFEDGLSGELTGVGAEIGIRGGAPTIVRILADSPAEANGLKAGDKILTVNNEPVQDLTTEQVASKIRGDAGTTVKILIQRDSQDKDFSIVRARVNNPSVRWEVKDSIGYLTLSRFDDETTRLARSAAKQFTQQNVRAVILDLRDNGGGYLQSARDVAGIWLNNKLVVTEKRGDKTAETINTGNAALLDGVKTIVLVNGGSASASEIVAGALQDYKAATIIGEKTFGKGTVQNVINLPDGRTLKVTVARWFMPSGKSIEQQGVSPDKTVTMNADDTDAGRDPQMDAAIAEAGQ